MLTGACNPPVCSVHACPQAVSKDDRYLASCGHDGTVRVWSRENHEQAMQFQVRQASPLPKETITPTIFTDFTDFTDFSGLHHPPPHGQFALMSQLCATPHAPCDLCCTSCQRLLDADWCSNPM